MNTQSYWEAIIATHTRKCNKTTTIKEISVATNDVKYTKTNLKNGAIFK